MTQPDKVGEIRIEEVARPNTEPLMLAVHIVDRDGKYFGHAFKKPAGFDKDIRIPIFEGLWDYDGELKKARRQTETEKELRQIAYKERAELEQQSARLRPYLTALQNMSDRYPDGLYVHSLDSFVTGEMIKYICEQIADEAAQIQEADAQHAAADRVFEQ